MSKLPINGFAELTGLSRQVCAKKLRDLPHEVGKHSAKLYDSRVALPALYNIDQLDRSLDLNQARARLAEKQFEKIDFEMELKRGGLINYEDLLPTMQRMFVAFRTRLLSVPTKAAPLLSGIADPILVQENLEEFMHEALEEIQDLETFIRGYDPATTGGVSGQPEATEAVNG